MLLIPASGPQQATEVRVPTIGAFVLNKGNTFHLRGGRDAAVLYLRDIVAAGERMVEVLEHDLDSIVEVGGTAATAVQRAAYHLRHVAPRYYGAAAEILGERDGLDAAAARGDLEGYLTDVAEIVASRRSDGEALEQEDAR